MTLICDRILDATMGKARQIIALYKDMGIDKSRILIKVILPNNLICLEVKIVVQIGSTYQGIKAAEQLQKEGIQ